MSAKPAQKIVKISDRLCFFDDTSLDGAAGSSAFGTFSSFDETSLEGFTFSSRNSDCSPAAFSAMVGVADLKMNGFRRQDRR